MNFKLRRAICFIALILCIQSRFVAQQVQWANSVIDFSSQKNTVLFSAQQALGKPNKYPDMCFSTCAWMPDTSSKRTNEYIQVAFSNPIKAQQLVIVENFNPGHIRKIVAFDSLNHAVQIYANPVKEKTNKVGNLFVRKLTGINFRIYAIRVETDKFIEKDPYQIDAIGLTTATSPISIPIHAPDSLLFASNAEILSNAVNSEYDEVYPIISPDGKTLFFDRKVYPENMGTNKNDDIWYSQYKNYAFTPAKNIGIPLNNDAHNFLCSISPDGNTALVGNAYDTAANVSGVSIATRTDSGWSHPVTQRIAGYENKTPFNEFNLGVDGRTLLMSIQKDDGFGLRDIYVSFSSGPNSWSHPLNLGKDVNTAGYEMSPFLAADGITLYFSSNGYGGYGSQDIYMTKRLDDTWVHWSEPLNLGNKVNSSDWEAYYSIEANGSYAYYSSSYTSKSNSDIFRIKLPAILKPDTVIWLTGIVTDQVSGKAIQAQVSYAYEDDSLLQGTSLTNGTSGYKLLLPRSGNYIIQVTALGYYSTEIPAILVEKGTYKSFSHNFELIPKKTGTIVEMNNILFKVNSAVLEDTSYTELDRIVNFLKDNAGMHIEVRGHTNGLCDDDYCNKLSEKRAKSVADYFISKGINPNRLTYKGYGKSIPIADNTTLEGKKKNQRVEFMITQAE